MASVVLAGCGKPPPREYTKVEFEVYVAQKCKLKAVKLDPHEGGRYGWTGVDDDGREYHVAATQEPNRLTWKAVHDGLKPGGVVISTSGAESR